AFCQQSSFECNIFSDTRCNRPAQSNQMSLGGVRPQKNLSNITAVLGTSAATEPRESNYLTPVAPVLSPRAQPKPGFRWKRALFESFTFFSIEQAYLVQREYHWVTIENGVPFNHYWSDYKHSLSTWAHSGWDDGDPFLDNYIGHPIQGALTGYIQVQNDPLGERLEFANSKQYWRSRFKAMLWNAAYSTQWEIGPLSEMTIEKYGTVTRGRWNQNGT